MAEPPTAQIKASSQALFSPQEVLRLMRGEFDRARRYRYPVVLLLITVDRLRALQDLYGVDVKDEILNGLTHRLKTAARSSDLLACTVDDRLLVLVPQTEAAGVAVLARRILKEARGLELFGDGRPLRVTVSVGGAENQRHEEVDFETMLEVAEGGNTVAQRAGGDRYVHSELYDFFQEKHARDARGRPRGSADSESVLPVDLSAIGGLIGDKIRELFGLTDADVSMVTRIEREVTAQLLRDLRERQAEEGDREEHQQKIEILERRIAKLTQQLGMTEEQLANVMRMKNIDPGIASIYSSVQGLTSQEAQAELKKELMAKIFEANLELRRMRTEQDG